MSSHKLIALTLCFVFAALAFSVHLAVAMPATQEDEPLKPVELDASEQIVVLDVSEVLTASQGLVSLEPAAVVMSQNFEGAWPAAGWELDDYSTSDGGEYLWGKRTCHPHTGSNAGWSVGGGAQGSALSCSANYPNNVYTWASYGPFDLRGATSASLTFHMWGVIESSTTCAFDYFFVGSSTDNQQFSGDRYCGNWTTGSDGNGYYRRTLNLSNRLGQSQVWVAFVLRSDFSVVFNGMTIDDVTLDVVGPTPPTPSTPPTPTDTPTPTPTASPTFTPPAPQRIAANLPLVMRQVPPTPTPTPTPVVPIWRWQHGQRLFNGLHFINANRGWAVGEWGLIVRTDDGGQTWSPQVSGTTTTLNAVQFVNANVGWAIGDSGTILHTTDGGASWRTQSSPYAIKLEVMSFVDTQRGWIGLPDGVLKTTNGGVTWVKTGTGIPAKVNDIQFFDANNGVLVTLSAFAGRGVVKITSDGGETWRETACNAPLFDDCDTIWALHFPNPGFGIAVGGFVSSDQYVSTDGGATWTRRGPSIQFTEPNEVYFTDASNGWAVAGNKYLRTSDGGNNWSQFNAPYAYDIQLLTPSIGFVASYEGVLKTADNGYTFTKSDRFDGPGAHLNDVGFADTRVGWSVGSGRIWHTTDGGQNWILQRGDIPSLKAVFSTNTQRAWTVGSGGRIFATTNGGTSWVAQTASTNYNLFDVAFVDDQYGWIVGEESSNYNPNGRVWRTTNGGAQWTQSGYFSGYEQGAHGKFGVDFVNRNVGFIVGQEVLWGSVHKTTDGGNTWTLKPLGGNFPVLKAVDFIDANQGWVVGNNGFVARTTNGGDSWQVQVSGVTYNLTGVKFLNNRIGYAIGSSVLYTNDGGVTWTPITTGSTRSIWGVEFVDVNHGWIVGSDGTILAYR